MPLWPQSSKQLLQLSFKGYSLFGVLKSTERVYKKSGHTKYEVFMFYG